VTRRTLWLVAGVAALVLVGLLGRTLVARQAASVAVAPAPAAAIELAAGDVATARRAELVTQLQVSGGLKAAQSAVVKAKVAAELKTLTVREGDRVVAGQLIGQLDNTETTWRLRQAEDQAAAAQAQLDVAQRTLDNNKSLVNQGFISRNALDTSVSNVAGAAASLQAARAAAEIARKAVKDCEIRAPLSGMVSVRVAQPGERVAVDGRIVEVVDLSHIELEAAVAPEDVLALRVGQTARVQVDGLAETLAGRVARINPSAQTGTRSVMAYLALPASAQAAGLRQGLFARATVDLQRQTALVVPTSALRFDQALPFVLLVENGKVVRRTVVTGARGDVEIDGRVEAAIEVKQGLQDGAMVLRGTVGSLRDGTLLKVAAVQTVPGAAAVASAAVAAPAPLPASTPAR
jgi:RND family efflux transporter MFP subunit